MVSWLGDVYKRQVVVSVVGGDCVPSVVVGDVVCFVNDDVVSDVVGDVVCLDVDVVSLVDIPSVIVLPLVWSSTIDRVDPGVVVSVVVADVPSVVIGDVACFVDDAVVSDVVADVIAVVVGDVFSSDVNVVSFGDAPSVLEVALV